MIAATRQIKQLTRVGRVPKVSALTLHVVSGTTRSQGVIAKEPSEPGLTTRSVGSAAALQKGLGRAVRGVFFPFRRQTKMKPEPRRRNEHRRED